ncbi:uncharacterized protein [Diadema antillarum]|uniref:uncharacterized protein n=1 Tax=Diadema antillarum TaxID=105358 RepID=UPI003A87FD1B
MAERRRIIPASVGPLFSDQRDTKTPPALRLELDLRETTEETCPEFAYPVLVKNAGGEEAKESKVFNDVEEDDLAGLAAIAKKFEEKYNVPSRKGKKKRIRLEELLDAGMGYDESDPFVDNSECYDELVPSSLTTQFGGFYINTGQLKFREVSDSDDGDFQGKKPKTPKKKKKLKLENGERKKEKKMKRKFSSDSGGTGDRISKKVKKHLQKKLREEKKRRKRGPRIIRTPTVAELLKRNNVESPQPPQPRPATSSVNGAPTSAAVAVARTAASQAPSSTAQRAVSSVGGTPGAMDMSLDLGISEADLNMDMDKELMGALKMTIASMNGTDGLEGMGLSGGGAAGSGGDVDSDANVSPVAPGAEEGSSKQIVPLPHALPLQLVDNIQKIKEAARKSVEGKTKFFNGYVNGLLLKIEHGTRVLSCSKRSAVYGHLANHLPCTKLTLQKRAKKLQLGAQDNQLKEPLQRLREAVAEVLPEQERRYKSEVEEAMLNMVQGPDGKLIEQKPPKKKFVWDDRLRKLLCDVVLVKVKTFEISKSRTQSLEEYLKAFLESEVKGLWPKDWIQTRNLFKESREVHNQVTSNAARQRKIMSGGPRKLLVSKKAGEEGEGSSMNPAPSTSETVPAEDEPSSSQPISKMVGSPITAKHLEDVPTLLDYVGSGEDSMEAIPSAHQKEAEWGVSSSDSNQEVSPSTGAGQGGNVAGANASASGITTTGESNLSSQHDIPDPGSSPLQPLDPEFLVSQLLSKQLVTDLHAGDSTSETGTPVPPGGPLGSLNQTVMNRTSDVSGGLLGQVDLTPKGGQGLGKKTVKPGGEPFSKQLSTDFDPSQQPYAAKLSAISNAHTMRTLHNQEPGLQAKDVTSSGMVGTGKIRPMGGSVPTRDIPVSQPVIRLMRDMTIEKMTAQSSSRVKLQTVQQKGGTTSSVAKKQSVPGGGHAKAYSQSASNTPIQGRSGVTSSRMNVGGAMDPTSLPQMSSQQVSPGNGNIRVSPSSQSTSLHTSYITAAAQQRSQGLHGGSSAFKAPSHSMPGQSATTLSPTSPSAAHSYSPTSQQYPPHQQYSPGHTSSMAAYSTSPSYQAMGSYGQMPLSDMTARQSSGGGNYTNSFPMPKVQSPAQAGVPQSPGDAVITGPAAGTYFHTQSAGGMLPTMQTTPTHSHPLPPEALDLLCTHQAFTVDLYHEFGIANF